MTMRSLVAWSLAAAVVVCVSAMPACAQREPSLLPPADSFRLTLTEEPKSKLPTGPSCSGDAEHVLMCRVFSLKLENLGKQTVHLGSLACAGPDLMLESHIEPPAHSSSEWWPLTVLARDSCPQLTEKNNAPEMWQNIRLKPGEAYTFRGRYLAKAWQEWPFEPGPHTLHAQLNVSGCTEDASHADCLTPLEQSVNGNWVKLWEQKSLTLESAPLVVTVPPEPDFGTPKFAISLETRTLQPGETAEETKYWNQQCTTANAGTLDCVLLHYTIRNITGKPVRVGHMTCSDFSLGPQYRDASGNWVGLKSTLFACTANFMVWNKLLPNETFDAFVPIRHVAAGYDVNPIRAAGDYDIRLLYYPEACIASPDASFCLSTPRAFFSWL